MQYNKPKRNRGFSLIEIVFASAIFAVVAVSIYQGFTSLTNLISTSREKIIAIDLMNEQFEILRNISFSNIGLKTGIPAGILDATSTVIRDSRTFEILRTVRNIDDDFDGVIGGSPNDLSPADYKLVEITINCLLCKNFTTMSAVSNFAPKNLETNSTNGALFIKVFDSNGVPVPQADVSITNSSAGISINETTDNSGNLQIVDAPPGVNAYRIVANKLGFTTDRTYATSTLNPNPVNPDATVVVQQVTQKSFVIDSFSNMNIKTLDGFCTAVGGVPTIMNGLKLIGSSPDVAKTSLSFSTDGSGLYSISNLEWDTFTFSFGSGYYLAGTNPIFPISALPGSAQNIDLVVSNDSPNFLLVGVKDSATGLPISDANVRLYGGVFDESLVTDRGFIRQTNWSGGSGQTNYTDTTRYFSSDGNIDDNNPVGDITLINVLGSYALSGVLTSSIFDTGTTSNWGEIIISPTDQPVQTGANSVRAQVATSPDNTATTSWSYLGPDGTASTYYDTSNNDIHPIHDGGRYIRYRIFLSTSDPLFTPNVSDIAVSFSSECIPPGQVLFSGLSNDLYTLDVDATGFQPQGISVDIIDSWSLKEILLQPI
jgi:prepilin-type N-terminal cleavage/methylation domain-containing protein